MAAALERGRMLFLVGSCVEALGALAKKARFALPTKALAGGKQYFIGAGHAHANLAHWIGWLDGVHLLDTVSGNRGPAEPAPRPGHVSRRGRVIDEVWMVQRDYWNCLGKIADNGLCFVGAITSDVIE